MEGLIKFVYVKRKYMARIKINPETVALLDMVEDRRSFILIRYLTANQQNTKMCALFPSNQMLTIVKSIDRTFSN